MVAIFDYNIPELSLSVKMAGFHSTDPKLDTGLKAFGLGKMQFEREMNYALRYAENQTDVITLG